MVRIAGGLMILSGCLGLGLWYRIRFGERIQILRSLGRILELLSSEVRYGRATLPECCGHVAKGLAEPYSAAFLEVGRRMEENGGDSFGEVFREELGKVLGDLPLRESDREAFLQFAGQTGFSDCQMQLRAMEQSGELLRNTWEKLEREHEGKCRMAVGFGAMGGLLLLLVLW